MLHIPALGWVCSSFSPLIACQNILFLSGQDSSSAADFGTGLFHKVSIPPPVHLAPWCTGDCFCSPMEGTRSFAKKLPLTLPEHGPQKIPAVSYMACSTGLCKQFRREISIWRGLCSAKCKAAFGRCSEGQKATTMGTFKPQA